MKKVNKWEDYKGENTSGMHLQWFAEGEEQPKGETTAQPEDGQTQEPAFNIDNIYKEHKDDLEKWIIDSGIGKKVMSSWKDQQVTQGLNTWKENHLQSEIEKKIDEAKLEWDKQGKLDPVEQAKAAARIEIDKFRAEAEKAKIKANASEMVTKLNLRLGKLTIDDFVRNSQDETDDVINRFYEETKELEKRVREEEAKKFVKDNNYTPKTGNSDGVPYGGSHEKHAEAIRRGDTPKDGPEFMKIYNAINDYNAKLNRR